jgi:hypothetical protein
VGGFLYFVAAARPRDILFGSHVYFLMKARWLIGKEFLVLCSCTQYLRRALGEEAAMLLLLLLACCVMPTSIQQCMMLIAFSGRSTISVR